MWSVVLSYAKFGKPLYSTRIIAEDINPVWEETAVLLVSSDEVKAKESLSIQLWDNDKYTADDLVGRVHIPLEEIMREPGKVQRRTDELQGFEDADSMRGSRTWSVAYYAKAELDQSLRTKKGTATDVPKEVEGSEELEQKPTMADKKDAADALYIPPRKDLKSGIFSVIVHQIDSLERQNLKGASGRKKNREGVAGQDTDAPEEEGPNLPNSYCEIYVNDAMVYKTRTKMYTSMPFFEAGTEVFVRDWTTAVVRIAVRDARLREHDPVLGIVSAKLTDLFVGSSQLKQVMALQEGVGVSSLHTSP
jgi:Ca2+-dependent lipid-binding protein